MTTTTEVTVRVRRHRPTGGDWGILAVLGCAGVHNLVAVGRRREPISGACRRHRVEHPVIVTAIGVDVLAHLLGVLPPRLDLLHGVGVAADWTAEFVRKCRPRRP